MQAVRRVSLLYHTPNIYRIIKADFLVYYSLRLLNYQDTFRFIVCSRREGFRHFISAIQFRCTLYFDIIAKQILTWKLSERRRGRDQYIDGVADVVEILKGREEPTILHTDQGSVYASMSYNDLILDTNIIRSMSRAGKPTDNPVNEALNGWIKEELYMDF